jgi:hypothetical protein
LSGGAIRIAQTSGVAIAVEQVTRLAGEAGRPPARVVVALASGVSPAAAGTIADVSEIRWWQHAHSLRETVGIGFAELDARSPLRPPVSPLEQAHPGVAVARLFTGPTESRVGGGLDLASAGGIPVAAELLANALAGIDQAVVERRLDEAFVGTRPHINIEPRVFAIVLAILNQ